MTTAGAISEKREPDIRQLMKTLIHNHSTLSIIRFFAAHPRGRFSRLAVVHAVDEDDGRREIERAMADLVSAGVLKTETDNQECYYRLTTEEPVRGIVLKTADLDWREWELVFVRA
jgi:hypothetical protein